MRLTGTFNRQSANWRLYKCIRFRVLAVFILPFSCVCEYGNGRRRGAKNLHWMVYTYNRKCTRPRRLIDAFLIPLMAAPVGGVLSTRYHTTAKSLLTISFKYHSVWVLRFTCQGCMFVPCGWPHIMGPMRNTPA